MKWDTQYILTMKSRRNKSIPNATMDVDTKLILHLLVLHIQINTIYESKIHKKLLIIIDLGHKRETVDKARR